MSFTGGMGRVTSGCCGYEHSIYFESVDLTSIKIHGTSFSFFFGKIDTSHLVEEINVNMYYNSTRREMCSQSLLNFIFKKGGVIPHNANAKPTAEICCMLSTCTTFLQDAKENKKRVSTYNLLSFSSSFITECLYSDSAWYSSSSSSGANLTRAFQPPMSLPLSCNALSFASYPKRITKARLQQRTINFQLAHNTNIILLCHKY